MPQCATLCSTMPSFAHFLQLPRASKPEELLETSGGDPALRRLRDLCRDRAADLEQLVASSDGRAGREGCDPSALLAEARRRGSADMDGRRIAHQRRKTGKSTEIKQPRAFHSFGACRALAVYLRLGSAGGRDGWSAVCPAPARQSSREGRDNYPLCQDRWVRTVCPLLWDGFRSQPRPRALGMQRLQTPFGSELDWIVIGGQLAPSQDAKPFVESCCLESTQLEPCQILKSISSLGQPLGQCCSMCFLLFAPCT